MASPGLKEIKACMCNIKIMFGLKSFSILVEVDDVYRYFAIDTDVGMLGTL